MVKTSNESNLILWCKTNIVKVLRIQTNEPIIFQTNSNQTKLNIYRSKI